MGTRLVEQVWRWPDPVAASAAMAQLQHEARVCQDTTIGGGQEGTGPTRVLPAADLAPDLTRDQGQVLITPATTGQAGQGLTVHLLQDQTLVQLRFSWAPGFPGAPQDGAGALEAARGTIISALARAVAS